jgi:hypothetical protein
MPRGNRMTITITEWGRQVIIESKRPGSKIILSDDDHRATIDFPDDEHRGKKFPREKK